MLKNRIKVSEFFFLDELVCPEIYNVYKEKSIYFLDYRLILGLITFRALLGSPLYINNWGIGGARKYSGLRPFDCTTGAKMSQHKFGRAFDIRSKVHSPDQLRAFLDDYTDVFVGNQLITGYELGTDTWTHIENRVWKVDPFMDDIVEVLLLESKLLTSSQMVQIPYWRAPKNIM